MLWYNMNCMTNKAVVLDHQSKNKKSAAMSSLDVVANSLLLDIRRKMFPKAKPREEMTKEEKLQEDRLLKDLFAVKYGVIFEEFQETLKRKVSTRKGREND